MRNKPVRYLLAVLTAVGMIAFSCGAAAAEQTREIDLGSILELLGGSGILGEGAASGSDSSSEDAGLLGGLLELLTSSEGGPIKNAVVAPIADQTYKGKSIRPNPKVTYEGRTLTRGTDYTLTYTNNTEVGTAKCVFKGKGKYTGTKTVSFRIVKKKEDAGSTPKTGSSGKTGSTGSSGKTGSTGSSGKTGSTGSSGKSSSGAQKQTTGKFTVTLTKSEAVYTGNALKPAVKVKAGSKSVSSDSYTVTYQDNRKVGKATVTVKGKGDYKGYTGTATFKIVPPKASLTSLTGGDASLTVKWKKVAVADGYQIEYCTRKGFDKNVSRKTVRDADEVTMTLTKLDPGKNYYVRIRAYTKVGSANWYGEWSSARNAKTNLSK